MATVEELCKDLASSDQVRAYKARQSLWDLVGDAGAPARARDKAKLAQSLTAWLVPPQQPEPKPKSKVAAKTPPKTAAKARMSLRTGAVPDELHDLARQQALRILSVVAGKEQVKAIQSALDDFDVRDSARYCLERMTCPEAGEALAEAATQAVGTEFRVGVINALARKSGLKAIAALKECAKDKDLDVRLAAAEALACHPDPSHDKVIVAVIEMRDQPQSGRRAAARLTRARMRLADRLAADGNKNAAKAIYTSIAGAKVDPAQQQAAKAALTRLG